MRVTSRLIRWRDVLRVGFAVAALAASSLAPGLAHAASIAGTVFEDINYGGGAGRNRATAVSAGGSARASARVELFNSAGTYVTNATTNASGAYSFTGLAAGNYTVRVVNSSVSSARTGYVSSLRSVQTFRANAATGTAVAVTDRVGGENPLLIDAGNGSTTLAALTTATTTAQSIAPVSLAAAGTNVTGVDFGFNFSTIVNVNNSGQGSLQQFITNANALGGKASLAQAGSRIDISGSAVALPAGTETSIFTIPSGAATPGHSVSQPNQLTSGIAAITLTSALSTITAANIALDGSTQTANVGDTNTGFVGAGGSVGTRGTVLAQIPKPEVQITGSSAINNGIYATAASTIVRGFAIRGFGSNWVSRHADIHVAGSGSLVELNVVGSGAAAFADPVSGRSGASGVAVEAGSTTVRNNLVGWINFNGIYLYTSDTAVVVSGNEIRNVDQANHGCDGDAIGSSLTGNTTTVSGNLIVGSGSVGVDPVNGSYTITDNTITGNGVANNTCEPWGIWVRNTASTASWNVINNSYGAGARVTGNARLTLSQNSIFGNGTITKRNGGAATGTIGIDIGGSGVTANDGAKTTGQPNRLMDHPIITSAQLSGTTLTLTGYVGSAAGQSTFASSTVEFFIADGDPTGYGEGQTYLGTLTTDAAGNFSGTLSGVSGVTAGTTRITATATDASGYTSEFGPQYTSTSAASLVGSFNAFETSTPANNVTGVIKTKIAGQAFTLDLVALNSARNAYIAADLSPVTVELLDASNDSGALNATTQCRSTWTVIATVTTTFAFANGDNGRKALGFTLSQARRNVRVRMSTTAGSSPIGCSTNNFAVRPAAFVGLTATDGSDSATGTTRTLNNSSATSGVVHRAGRPFSVVARAVNFDGTTTTANYDGAPALVASSCVIPSGCTAGTLSSALTSTAGNVAGTADYSEAGVIAVDLQDVTFAVVDASDSSAAERTTSTSAAVTFGRFVPAAYRLTLVAVPTFAPPACGAGLQSFVYVGQGFGFGTTPQVTATPINASGTALNNARPRFTSAHVSSSFAAAGALAAFSGAANAAVSGSSIITIAFDAGAFSFTRASTPVAQFTPSITQTVNVADTTENGTAGNSTINGEAPLSIGPIAFSNGASTFYYARVALRPTVGDWRRSLTVPLEVLYFNGTGWVPLTAAANCLSAGSTVFAYSEPTGALNGGGSFNCATRALNAADGATTVATNNGRGAIGFTKPANTSTTQPSAMTLTLNLLASASGMSCSAIGTSAAATTINAPWLATPSGTNPTTRVTWNRTRGDHVTVRERFD